MDTVGDFLTRIRNASAAGHAKLDVPSSRLREGMVAVLKEEGFVSNYKVVKDGKQGLMRIYLLGAPKGKIGELKRISSPGRRVFVGVEDIPLVRSGLGVGVISTSSGVMSSNKALSMKIGGELLCTVW